MMLGNLSTTQIEKRIGIDFPDEIREFMRNSNQSRANNVKDGRWHCFDIPFHMVCGDMETAQIIYDSIKDRTSEVKEQLQFSIRSK